MEAYNYEMTHLDHETDEQDEIDVELPASSAYALDNRRRAALAEVDNAHLSWSHAKVCIVAGVGFFTDAYDLFAINIASTMLGYVYGQYQRSSLTDQCTNSIGEIINCTLTPNQDLGVKVAAQVGTLFGQLFFGWLADILGRKKMYGIELLIIIVATFGQAIAGQALKVNIFGVLIAWRVIMGLGIGGDYPLSAIISSEFAATKIRGRMMSAVFAAQGFGSFTASLLAVIITVSCKGGINGDNPQATIDFMWRLFIGLGAVPAAVALYFRLTIPETPRFTMDVKRNLDKAAADISAVFSKKETKVHGDKKIFSERLNIPKGGRRDFISYFGKRQNFKVLFGTAYCWFALDIAFYGLGLNASTILQDVGFFPKPTSTYDALRQVCVINLILSAVLIPGYWVTFLFIDSWGRKPIQLLGFSVLTVLFLVFGFGYSDFTTPSTSNSTMPSFSDNLSCSCFNMTSPSNLDKNDKNLKANGFGGTHRWAFFIFYCIAGFFENFGPNVTTFVIPGEVFPTRYRSTAHGISAASGKLGSIIAQIIISKRSQSSGSLKVPFEIFAFFMMSGIASTLLLPETKGRSLEELSNEEQKGFVHAYE